MKRIYIIGYYGNLYPTPTENSLEPNMYMSLFRSELSIPNSKVSYQCLPPAIIPIKCKIKSRSTFYFMLVVECDIYTNCQTAIKINPLTMIPYKTDSWHKYKIVVVDIFGVRYRHVLIVVGRFLPKYTFKIHLSPTASQRNTL